MSEVLKQFLLSFLLEVIHAEMLKLGHPDINAHVNDLPVEHRAELSALLSDLSRSK